MQHTAIQQFKIIKNKLERNHNISTQNLRNLKPERNSNREIEIQSTEIRRRNPAKNHGQKNTYLIKTSGSEKQNTISSNISIK